ncbi:MAG: phosphoenolpyruvate carboxylase [Chromatiales bacterium]|nr:MAG: phosphoenolpyruvate carboxylase [Chromatiales bacterium]
MSSTQVNEATGLHPTARPAEKRSDIQFGAKDAGLRKDVHDLGAIMGELLKEQGGESLFDTVERARRLAIDRREGDREAGQRLDILLQSLPTDLARDFVRAFSTYFQLVNTAEQVHRIRRRRAYLKDSAKQQPGGLEATVTRLKDLGFDLDALLGLLGDLQVEPVFTAHPSEPTRRTILRKQQEIVRHLIEIQNPILTPRETAAHYESIRDQITSIWQTEEQPAGERTSFDELEHVLFFATEVIYRAVPVFYETLREALVGVHGAAITEAELPTIFRLASWIGSDIDSRPDTTARTIRETLSRQRALALNLYHDECRTLAEKLSQSGNRTNISRELVERSDEYAEHFPNAAGSIPLRHRDMLYRVFLRLIMARLQATFDDDAFPYESPEEFQKDLQLIADSLQQNKGHHAGLFFVRRLLRRVETFGFHFMMLDIRQNALVNRRVVGRCLREDNWLDRSEEERARRIAEALERNESPCADLDNETRRDLAVFQAIAFCRRRFGKRAIGPYVVSMAHGVDDVLSVILLARWADLRKRNGTVPLDIAPHFETVEDLSRCGHTMAELLRNPIYRDHLECRGNRQTVVVSYSDSNMDSGMIRARWSLYKAQADLVRVLDEGGVELTLCHGRGGTISRGGGKTHAAVMGAPPGAVRGHLRATERGGMVNSKYGLRGIAVRTLEQAVSAVALATAVPEKAEPEKLQRWGDVVGVIAEASRKRYQDLVYGDDDFYAYFRAATPADAIQRMQHPGQEDTQPDALRNLRAVPWDFAWSQCRNLLPGWYGSGTGLAAAVDRAGLDTIREMLAQWPFFASLLSDLEMVLGKADLNIASRYSQLAGPLHERFFPGLRIEFDLCVETLLRIKDQQVLLEEQAALRRSIRLRNPYVDPMNLLQVDLLRRWRAGGRQDEELYSALVASVNGIARGIQDTG